MLFGLLLILSPSPIAQGVIHVDDTATGANDGTSWADAFTDLQSALAVALPPLQVWVAEGTYKPTPGLDKFATFKPRTWTYGGFAGHETALGQRAGLFESTILSGDLLGDDGPGFANVTDNSETVVQFDWAPGALERHLDGFTITGGNAVGGWGGGVVAAGVDAFALANCRFVANRASSGGGLAVILASGRVADCTFLGNEGAAGGGVFVDIGSGVVFERCWFLGNRAGHGGGGGMLAHSPTLSIDCVFSGNSTDGLGGGGLLALQLQFPTRLMRCTLVGNSAMGSTHGGGGLLLGSYAECAQATVVDSILWGNVDDSGGGQGAQVRTYGTFDPVLASCCVQGWIGLGCSTDVFDADPRFLDADGLDDVAGTLDDRLELGPGSPCIDAGRHFRGLPGVLGLLDAAGKRRFVDLLHPGDGKVLDLGALERPAGG